MNRELTLNFHASQEPAMPLNLTIQRLGWKLTRNNGRGDVKHGDQFLIHNGAKVTVTGGMPPMKPGSTGRITVREDDDTGGTEREFFPGVCDLSWVRL